MSVPNNEIELSPTDEYGYRDPVVTFHDNSRPVPASSTTPITTSTADPTAIKSTPQTGSGVSPHVLDPSSFPGAIIRYAGPVPPPFSSSSADVHVITWALSLISHVHLSSLLSWQRIVSASQYQLFTNRHLYKCALIEFVGTMVLTIFAVGAGISVSAHPQDYSYPPTAVGILIGAIIPIMIFTTAPSSGGHLNSLITIATWMAGLCEFPRAVLYVGAQITGSIAGSYALRALLNQATIDATLLGMCLHGHLDAVTAFSCEFFFSFILLFVAFGVALDPKQLQAVGPNFAPFIIGATMGLIIYITSAFDMQYTGAIVNPTRCLGPAIAMGMATKETITVGSLQVKNYQWVYWVATVVASAMHATIYRLVPPGYMAVAVAQAPPQAAPQAESSASHPTKN